MSRLSAKGIRRLRIAVAVGVLGAAAGGVCLNADLGTLCAWCPVGFAQASAAAQALLPGIGAPLLAFAILALVAGRAFCAWGCPTNLLKKRGRPSAEREGAAGGAKTGRTRAAHATAPLSESAALGRSLVLLGGLLAVSFAVGFPVFCLFCPIGLAFGFMFALFKSLTIYQPSWDLIVFPALLFAEFRLLRSWCRVICPLGALFGLVSRLNPRRLRPRASRRRCQQAAGCHACEDACPEGLPAAVIGKSADEACTLCLACTPACPHGALRAFDVPHDRAKGGSGPGEANTAPQEH